MQVVMCLCISVVMWGVSFEIQTAPILSVFVIKILITSILNTQKQRK